MEQNNAKSFYQKLFARIIFIFCLFFIVALNFIRFNQLYLSPKPKPLPLEPNPSFFYSVVFQNHNLDENKNKILFLENRKNLSYLKPLLSFIESSSFEQIFLINCTHDDLSYFEPFLDHIPSIQVSCDIDQGVVKEIIEDKTSLIIAVFENQSFNHQNILHAAERFSLKPKIQISEIKNEN